jgi:hypothetical protein
MLVRHRASPTTPPLLPEPDRQVLGGLAAVRACDCESELGLEPLATVEGVPQGAQAAQENTNACTWGYGTFDVDGNRMSWSFTDGGGIAPNNAVNRPGEFFVFDFSAYRDTLTVSPVEGQISPLGFRDKPWRRVSDTPSRRYFSKRCPPPTAALRG